MNNSDGKATVTGILSTSLFTFSSLHCVIFSVCDNILIDFAILDSPIKTDESLLYIMP